MSTAIASRNSNALSTSVLSRLADRWRTAGISLACYASDGSLLWHDSQMPRLLALCATCDQNISLAIRRVQDPLIAPSLPPMALLPGIEAQLVPISHRRKTIGWLGAFARIGQVELTEELQRLASRGALDARTLVTQAPRIPLLDANLMPSLVALIGQMYDDLLGSSTAHVELAGVTEQLSSVYEEIHLLHKISSGMRFSQKPRTFLESVCREMQEIGNFHAVAIAFAHREDESALPVVGELAVLIGDCQLQGQELINALHAPIHESLTLGETVIHNDLSTASDHARLRDAMQRFVCVPLTRDRRPLGILLAIDKNDHSDFNSVDLKLLNNVGSQCAIFMENAALYLDMQELFMGVLHALTRSIDAKDAYTRGHSQRVAELSRMLARKIGLPEEQCERVYLSGLLHDIGKIGAAETVLTKPGRLTDAEFEAIKKHPAIGAQILGNIKQLQDIIPGVLYHHERWDGRGYPYNLAGENIPLLGRIVGVADAYDAMSSTRTYRPALPLDTVLSEIKRCAGAQFDPSLARIFVTLDFSEHRRAVEEQLQAMLQAEEVHAP